MKKELGWLTGGLVDWLTEYNTYDTLTGSGAGREIVGGKFNG